MSLLSNVHPDCQLWPLGVAATSEFISPIAGRRKRLNQYTAIDDCSRLRVLRIYERLNQKIAIQFIDLVLNRLPFKVESIQTAKGGEFQSSFHWHLRDRGIQHIYIKPLTPASMAR